MSTTSANNQKTTNKTLETTAFDNHNTMSKEVDNYEIFELRPLFRWVAVCLFVVSGFFFTAASTGFTITMVSMQRNVGASTRIWLYTSLTSLIIGIVVLGFGLMIIRFRRGMWYTGIVLVWGGLVAPILVLVPNIVTSCSDDINRLQNISINPMALLEVIMLLWWPAAVFGILGLLMIKKSNRILMRWKETPPT